MRMFTVERDGKCDFHQMATSCGRAGMMLGKMTRFARSRESRMYPCVELAESGMNAGVKEDADYRCFDAH